MSFATRQQTELEIEIKHALQNMHEPCTLSELCNSCKTFCRQVDKVKRTLQHLSLCDIIEMHDETFMLKSNVTEQIRHEWINKISEEYEKKAEFKREPASYADAVKGDNVKRRASAPEGITHQHYKPYSRSVSDITPSTSTNIGACGDNKPLADNQNVTVNINYNVFNNTFVSNCDFSRDKCSHYQLGDHANVQVGNNNQMTSVANRSRGRKNNRRK